MANTHPTGAVPGAKRGKPAGKPIKATVSSKENIMAVFTRLGGTAAMAEWARANQTEFYRIYARLIPTEVTGAGGGPLTVEIIRFSANTTTSS